MRRANPQIAVDCLTGILSKRSGPAPTALPDDIDDVRVEIHILEDEAGDLAQSAPRVDEGSDDGRIPALLE